MVGLPRSFSVTELKPGSKLGPFEIVALFGAVRRASR
jgi:hypothetical protein